MMTRIQFSKIPYSKVFKHAAPQMTVGSLQTNYSLYHRLREVARVGPRPPILFEPYLKMRMNLNS